MQPASHRQCLYHTATTAVLHTCNHQSTSHSLTSQLVSIMLRHTAALWVVAKSSQLGGAQMPSPLPSSLLQPPVACFWRFLLAVRVERLMDPLQLWGTEIQVEKSEGLRHDILR